MNLSSSTYFGKTGQNAAIYRSAGPAVDPVIKITNIVALLILAVLANH